MCNAVTIGRYTGQRHGKHFMSVMHSHHCCRASALGQQFRNVFRPIFAVSHSIRRAAAVMYRLKYNWFMARNRSTSGFLYSTGSRLALSNGIIQSQQRRRNNHTCCVVIKTWQWPHDSRSRFLVLARHQTAVIT